MCAGSNRNNYGINPELKLLGGTAQLMDDLFRQIEKKMEELNHSHSQMISLIEAFKNSINQKEIIYRNKFEELKTLFDIYSQYKSITLRKNKDEIGEVSTKFSNTSLRGENDLIEKLLSEKSKDNSPSPKTVAFNQSLISSSLVGQISEHFSRNPALSQSARLVDESFYSTDRQSTVRNTSSPMSTNCNDFNNKRDHILKFGDCLENVRPKSRVDSSDLVNKFVCESFVTPVKSSSKINYPKSTRNLSSKELYMKSCTVATVEGKGNDTFSSENLSDSSYIETDGSFGSATSSVYSSRQFYEKANSYSFISPLSSVRSSGIIFSTLHYCESKLFLDSGNDCLVLRKNPKFSGGLEQSVVETLAKYWKPKHVYRLRALINSYFCRRLYNSQRVFEIRNIIKECERIHRTIGDVPTHEDKLLAKAIAADIKLHKEIVHNIFFETTLNSKLVMINEVLENVDKAANHSRILRRQKKYIPVKKSNNCKPSIQCCSPPPNDSKSSFHLNKSTQSSSHPYSSNCIYTESLSQKNGKIPNHFSKSSR